MAQLHVTPEGVIQGDLAAEAAAQGVVLDVRATADAGEPVFVYGATPAFERTGVTDRQAAGLDPASGTLVDNPEDFGGLVDDGGVYYFPDDFHAAMRDEDIDRGGWDTEAVR